MGDANLVQTIAITIGSLVGTGSLAVIVGALALNSFNQPQPKYPIGAEVTPLASALWYSPNLDPNYANNGLFQPVTPSKCTITEIKVVRKVPFYRLDCGKGLRVKGPDGDRIGWLPQSDVAYP